MANEEHLAKLREDIDTWNQWRVDNPELKPDLKGANLEGANLIWADLKWADLSEADLRGADLRFADLRAVELGGTDLIWSNLSEADLRGADLSGLNLERVDLTAADLREADLSEAGLWRTNLSLTQLDGAKFNRAILDQTVFGSVDLRGTTGLDSCVHAGPSVIDYRTLERFTSLPLAFLRGCGLPDHYIEYLPSLTKQPIQYYSCSISYSSQDEEFTQRLHADLQNKGVRCWYAPEDMKIGDKIRTRIDEVIRLHQKLLLVLSDQSIDSDWVEKEVETAFEKERKNKETVLFPIRLDDSVMQCETGWAADIKRSRQIGDFQSWKDHDSYKKAFDRLLRDLKADE